jgi:hypothetical protein
MGIKVLCRKCGKAVCVCGFLLSLGVSTLAFGQGEPPPDHALPTIFGPSVTIATGTTSNFNTSLVIRDQVTGNEFTTVHSDTQHQRMLLLGYSPAPPVASSLDVVAPPHGPKGHEAA